MPSNYTGVPGNIVAGSNPVVSEPVDGDADNGASFQTPYQTIVDYLSYLDRCESLSSVLAPPINFTIGVSVGTNPFAICPTRLPESGASSAGTVKWIAAAAAGALWTMSGVVGTWTSRTANQGAANLIAAYSNGTTIVVVGAPNATVPAISTSTDGITWTARANGTGSQTLNAVTWSNPRLFVQSTTASDGVWFYALAFGTSGNSITVTYNAPAGSTTSVGVVGNAITVSPKTGETNAGVVAAIQASAAASALVSAVAVVGTDVVVARTLATLAGLWAACGSGGYMVTSPDGTTWTSRSAGAVAFTGIVWAPGPGMFIATSASTATYQTSIDGVTWTSRTLPTSAPNATFAAGSGVVVYWDSTTSLFYSSVDGINWVSHSPPANYATNNVGSIVFNGKLFVANTLGTSVITSFDGLTWTSHGTTTATGLSSQVAANQATGQVFFFATTIGALTVQWQTPP